MHVCIKQGGGRACDHPGGCREPMVSDGLESMGENILSAIVDPKASCALSSKVQTKLYNGLRSITNHSQEGLKHG